MENIQFQASKIIFYFYFSRELLSIINKRNLGNFWQFLEILGSLGKTIQFFENFDIFQMEFSVSDQCGHLGPQGVVCLYV